MTPLHTIKVHRNRDHHQVASSGKMDCRKSGE